MHPRVTRSRRRRRPVARALFVVIGVMAGLLSLGVTPSSAAAEDDITFRGTMRNAGQPLEGVEVIVTAPDGSESSGTSDETGRIEVQAPRIEGTYTITLNEDSLPEGVSLREGQPAEETIELSATGMVPALAYEIGADTRQVETKWEQVPQLLYNGLLFGIVMALGALGLSMVFGTTGLTNFAHGELVTFGALVTFMFNTTLGFPLAVSALLALILGAAFGWLQDKALWAPLRKRGTGLIAMMIVSIGLQFFLRYLFQYFTGGRTENYDDYVTPSGKDFHGLFSYTYRDLIIAGISTLMIVAVTVALSKTRLGRATRAVADNPALSSSTGINVNRVISVVWIIGTALASLCGVFLAFSLGVTFQIGQLVLLLLFCAVILGGLGSVWGALIGSLFVGVFIEMSTLVISAELKNAGAMLLMVLILLVRPQGLLGRSERIG